MELFELFIVLVHWAGSHIAKKAMSRDKFGQIKRFLHVCDNNQLNKDDRYAKVRPLLDALNVRSIRRFSHKYPLMNKWCFTSDVKWVWAHMFHPVDMLKIVQETKNHRVFFDLFFSSYYLMCLLNERGFLGCGTVRKNGMMNVNLKMAKNFLEVLTTIDLTSPSKFSWHVGMIMLKSTWSQISKRLSHWKRRAAMIESGSKPLHFISHIWFIHTTKTWTA